jgi:hypothetical protein
MAKDIEVYKALSQISIERHNKLSEAEKVEQISIIRNLSEGKKVKAVSNFTKTTIEGKITKIDRSTHLLTIKERGKPEKVIMLLDFVVTIIPLLDIIISWFKRTFNFRRKK